MSLSALAAHSSEGVHLISHTYARKSLVSGKVAFCGFKLGS